MKVIAWPSPSGAREYRLDSVFKYINQQSKNQCVVADFPLDAETVAIPDVLVLQQTTSQDKIALANEARKQLGKLMVAELDDAFDVNDDSPFKELHDRLNAEKWLEVLVGVADCVTTTTNYMQQVILDRLSAHGIIKNVYVLPNYLDMEKWDIPVKRNFNKDEVRIVWAGSCTHRKDLESIKPVLVRIMTKYPQVKFLYYGDVKLHKLFDGLNSEFIDGTEIVSHPAKLHSLRGDIAIAPLIDTEFNRCKSPLKYLEYSMCGMAGVYSNIVYPETVKKGCGIIASTDEEWFNGLESLIINPELREEMATRAFIDVRANYSMQDHAMDWLNAYWCELSKKKALKLDIGSGIQPMRGDYVLLDINPRFGEMIADITGKIPVQEGTVERIHCSMTFEHIYPEELQEKVIPNFYKILKEGGTLSVIVPNWEAVKDCGDWEIIQQFLYGTRHKYIPTEHDNHKHCMDFEHLKLMLEAGGFKNIRKVEYTEGAHNATYTLAVECEK